MKARIGYKLWGSIDVDVDGLTPEAAHDRLLKLSVRQLTNHLEGMPYDIEGDAIEVSSIEQIEEGS